MVDNKSLGKAMQVVRKQRGITQEDAAKQADISYSTLAKIERGAIASPSFLTIAQLARTYGASLDDIAFGDTSQQTKKTDAIAFVYVDMNGVLVRFYQKAFAHIAAIHKLSPDLVETTFWHYNHASNSGEMTNTQFNKALSKRLGVNIDWQAEYMKAVEPIVAMHECVKKIAKTMPVGLLTNTMPGFVDTMRSKKLIPNVTFNTIVDSSVEGTLKPEPSIYRIAEQKAGVHGKQILFIDDSRTNLMAAEQFGWRVLWFDDYRPEESVKRVQAALTAAA